MNLTLLQILEDGTVRGLYAEAIDLTSLGTLQVERASTIEFENRVQLWRVFNRQGQCLYSSPSRAECLRWEQEYLST